MANENLCPKCKGPMAESYSTPGRFFCIATDKDCRIKELENRVRELTQRDPSCYDMSAEDAFKFAAEKQNKVLELERQLEEAKADAVDAESSAARMRELLTETANALKGEPEALKQHSWHDLPKLVLAQEANLHSAWAEVHDARSERDAALAESRKRGEENLVLREEISLIAQRAKDVAAVCCPEESRIADAYQTCANELEFTLSTTTFATAHQFVERIEREALEAAWKRYMAITMGKDRHPDREVRAAILGEKENN